MTKIIATSFWHGLGNNQIVEFEKGEHIYVRYILGDSIYQIAKVLPAKKGMKVVFSASTLAVVDTISGSGLSCKHLRLARLGKGEDLAWEEPGKGAPISYTGETGGIYLPPFCKPFPRLRRKLQKLGIPAIHIPGGFETRLVFRGEIAVPDYFVSGSRGWLVDREWVFSDPE